MGMLQTILRKVPDGKTSNDVIKSINIDLQNHFSEHDNSCDEYKVGLVNANNFDEIWQVQETYKDTPEIKEKYRAIAKDGRLVYAEIDY